MPDILLFLSWEKVLCYNEIHPQWKSGNGLRMPRFGIYGLIGQFLFPSSGFADTRGELGSPEIPKTGLVIAQ